MPHFPIALNSSLLHKPLRPRLERPVVAQRQKQPPAGQVTATEQDMRVCVRERSTHTPGHSLRVEGSMHTDANKQCSS